MSDILHEIHKKQPMVNQLQIRDKMKHLSRGLLILALLLGTVIQAGTVGKIAGKVTNTQTGEPLVGVNVFVTGTFIGGITDDKGRYFVLNIPPGTYTVEYRMIGYRTVKKEKVIINMDRTIVVDTDMELAVLEGEEITVVAQKPKVRTDVAFSQQAITADEIIAAPTGQDIREMLAMNIGVTRDDNGMLQIRGSSADGIAVYVDNFNSNDSRLGNPDIYVSKEAIQEIQIIRGGFSAEYGQARSGMINIVKKDGSRTDYSGSLNIRTSPADYKHFGPDLYSPENWWDVGRFLSMDSTEDRNLDGDADFEGWKSWYDGHKSSALGNDSLETYEIWKWRHRPRAYADKPDYYIEGTFGGPVPFTNGKVTFFIDGFYDYSLFPFPAALPAYTNNSTNLKLKLYITPKKLLYVRVGYGNTKSIAYWGEPDRYVNPHYWLNASKALKELNTWRHLYDTDGRMANTDISRVDLGIEFEHALNRNSFYNIRFHYNQNDYLTGHTTWRDPDTLGWIGDFPRTEEPWGFVPDKYKDQLGYHCMGAGNGNRDSTRYATYTFVSEYTNQITNEHQIKTGFGTTLQRMFLKYGVDRLKQSATVRYESWKQRDIDFHEGYAYIQDKIEFEGMVMNVGLRADYLEHNEPYFLDPYSGYYLKPVNYDSLWYSPTAKNEKPKIVISPRLGVSHPIGEFTKIYFNYGYFYQRPKVEDIFINEQSLTTKMGEMGNPLLDYRKTISYELGAEQNIANTLTYTLTGYYKDVSQNIGSVNYKGTNGVAYDRMENNSYRDIRGFEFEARVNRGTIRAMFNYDYRITDWGQYGWDIIYQDTLRINELKSPSTSINKPRPLIRSYIGIATPSARHNTPIYKKILSDISFTTYLRWEAGDWITYHSDSYPGDEANNIQWRPEYTVDVRFEKGIHLGGFKISLYGEIRNLLNSKFLTSDHSYYYEKSSNYRDAYLEKVAELKMEPGDYDHPELKALLMSAGEYTLYGLPRDIWIGIKLNF